MMRKGFFLSIHEREGRDEALQRMLEQLVGRGVVYASDALGYLLTLRLCLVWNGEECLEGAISVK